MDKKFNADNKLLPIEYRNINDRERLIIDYIAGMMDSYAIKVYEDIYGENAVKAIYDPNYFGRYKY